MLSQLSYEGISVLPQGLEPWIHSLRDCCFNQFSYRSIWLGGGIWTHESTDLQSMPLNHSGTPRQYSQRDLNPWPWMYKIPALTYWAMWVFKKGLGLLWVSFTGSYADFPFPFFGCLMGLEPTQFGATIQSSTIKLQTQFWWIGSNYQLLPYESSFLPLKYIRI